MTTGRNWRAKYLTIERFEEFVTGFETWKGNDFHEIKEDVCSIKKKSKWLDIKLGFLLTFVGLMLAAMAVWLLYPLFAS